MLQKDDEPVFLFSHLIDIEKKDCVVIKAPTSRVEIIRKKTQFLSNVQFFLFFFQSCFKSATESHDQLHCKQRHKSRVTSKHPFFHGSFSLFTLQNSGTGQRSGPDPQIPPFSHSSHTISHLTEIKLHLLTVKTQNVPEPARPQSVNKQPLKGKFCLDRIQSWPKKPVWGSWKGSLLTQG